tara:strand:- start:1443 stop:1619 length:177 start_codon:yes stop_codon:yes gene_type:complete
MIKLKSKDRIISMLVDLLSDSDNIGDMSVEGWINALKWVLSMDDTEELSEAYNAETSS